MRLSSNPFVAMVQQFRDKFIKLGCWKRDFESNSANTNPAVAEMVNKARKKVVDLRLKNHVQRLEAIALQLEHDYKMDNDPRALRLHLLVEEVSEYGQAMMENDRVKIADALGDVIYVAIGGTLVYDIPIEFVFEEIHRSNMSKTNADGDGRMRDKGPLYSPPDIVGALNKGDAWIQWTNNLSETVEFQ